MKFDVLFHFSSGPIHLVETKRTDLPPTAGPGEIYRWSLIEEKSVKPLTFVSMSLNPQRRVFEEGMVQFDLRTCTGRLFEKDLQLVRQDSLSDSIRNLLEVSLKTK
jgi:hypothetical protein